MLHKIYTYINTHQLLTQGKPVVVGLSGGADSVALLSILSRLGYHCVAAHCNFHLRGEESNRDERFAQNVAEKFDVPFHKTDFDTAQYAGEKRISIEMAARELRYRWFEELKKDVDAQAIAVAHHRDDNVETLLLNLVRGTGIRGLRGMRPRNGNVVRPLLSVGREEILAWLEEQQQDYITDSSNLSDKYTRNFLRLRILPLLKEINPSVKEAIARTSEHLSAAEQIYLSVINEAKKTVWSEEGCILISEFFKYPAPDTVLYELLIPYNFTRLVVDDIFASLDKESGKKFYSSTHYLIKDRGKLCIAPIEKTESSVYLLEGEKGQFESPIELFWNKIVIDKEFDLKKNRNIAYFDYDRLTLPLTLRIWNAGDWFIPFGMKGRKKLSDYFSDSKLSLVDKEKTWLLCNGDDIIWIVGMRTDDRYKITKTTKHALAVNFSIKKL